jgi:hypothetical protein
MVMKTKNHQITTRHCAHCGQCFDVNPRLGKLHRYCSEPACAQASHRASHKKWLKRNGKMTYNTAQDNVDHVRNWRRRNPEYWKRKRPSKRLKNANFVLTDGLSAVLRYVALQDTIDTRLALEIGIISRISGGALQDTIAMEIRRLIVHGNAILRNKPVSAPE